MSEINSFSDYASKYNTNMDYSSLFGGGAPYIDNGMGGINVSDYAMIKNGSYGKLMKAYYAKQDADKLSQFGDSSKTLTLMRSSADSLKKSAEVLGDVSLYEKKKFKKKDEETGEEIEVEDYDWDAITKAVKTFVDDYNSVVEQAGNSETKNVLRNAAWMTGITEKAGNLLSKVGITIGKGNKLEFDEEGLKKKTTLGESGIEFDNISTLKSLFTGYGSFASQIERKLRRYPALRRGQREWIKPTIRAGLIPTRCRSCLVVPWMKKWVISSKIKIRSRTKTRIKRKIRVLIKLLKSKTDKKAMRKIEFALITMA